jgi:hypothetical protein
MPRDGRRSFIGILTGLVLGVARWAEPQAPAKVSMDEAGERRQRLGKLLRELNETAGLGVAPDDIERAEAYATGAILETEAKLRPLRLDDALDVPIVFRARRRP